MEQDRAPHVQLHHRELPGPPLTSYRTIIELIAATTTESGLKIRAAHYPRDVKITDDQLAAVPLAPHDWHGDWNYTINPPDPRE